MIPDAVNSAYSGNRLICAIQTNGELRYRVYDKQPDGSWGEGELVYEDEEGTIEFPTQQYSSIINSLTGIDISGDYAVIGTNNGPNSTYFIKKSKTTGKWYCAKGELKGYGYSVCISNSFLVSGNNTGEQSLSQIYPIDENGNLGDLQATPGIQAFKCSISGDVLATNNGVYKYNWENGQWNSLLSSIAGKSYRRVATDGKRMIMQTGANSAADVYIYNLATGKEEGWNGTRVQAGVGKPVAIYGDYALAGITDKVDICYRNPSTGLWEVLTPKDGAGFLSMMKHWDSSITLTKLSGKNITMKGTRAMIAGTDNGSFFIENIDKMVEDYLKGPY